MYTPQDDLVVDKLIFPPGMDVDSLLLGIDMNSEEAMIQAQNLRKKPQRYLIEKSYALKKWNFETNDFDRKDKSKKDIGYTLSATPYQEPESAAADLAQELSYEPAIDLKKYIEAKKDASVLDSKSLGAKEKLKEAISSLKAVEIHIEHPHNENAYIEAIEDPTERIAYKTWVTQNSLIYLVLDYMNFIEFKA